MSLPKHIGIIMDGNGRWAKSRGRGRAFGHIKGARVAKKIISACAQRGISHLTLYAFSTENWSRPPQEVQFLMSLLKRYLKREVQNLIKENIRFSVIGEIHRLPQEIQKIIFEAIELTKLNEGLHLIFAISYGSRNECVEAIKRITKDVLNHQIDIDAINEQCVDKYLSTYPTPDPDLIIRTSGEKRLSNFLLWQSAYSELHFTDVLWPDFSETDLEKALDAYLKRERRFGGILNVENTGN